MKADDNNLIDSYLGDVRKLQNYLVGFALAQSIAFLYSLETTLHYLVNDKWYIILAIFATVITNTIILIAANRNEIYILREKFQDTFLVGLAVKGRLFRLSLIWVIGLMTAIIFFFASSKYKPHTASESAIRTGLPKAGGIYY